MLFTGVNEAEQLLLMGKIFSHQIKMCAKKKACEDCGFFLLFSIKKMRKLLSHLELGLSRGPRTAGSRVETSLFVIALHCLPGTEIAIRCTGVGGWEQASAKNAAPHSPRPFAAIAGQAPMKCKCAGHLKWQQLQQQQQESKSAMLSAQTSAAWHTKTQQCEKCSRSWSPRL